MVCFLPSWTSRNPVSFKLVSKNQLGWCSLLGYYHSTTTASAATVCLGATYSPAHWQHKDPSRAGCIWPGAPLSVISIMSFGSVLPVPTSPLRVLLPPFLLASAGLLGKTHKLSNRSVFGSLSSSPSFGRFNINPVCPSFLGLLTLSPWLAVWPYPWWLLFVCNTCLTKEILFHLGSFHHTPSSSSARWGLLCAIDFAVVQCKDFFSLSLSLTYIICIIFTIFYIIGPAALRCHARESMVMCPSYIIHIIYRMGPPQL